MNKVVNKILFIIVLLIPLSVFANSNIIIKEVEEIEKSPNTIELDKAQINGDNIKISVKFFDVNDYIKYKLILNNASDKSFKIRDGKSNISSEYITYEVIIDDNNNTINKNESKEVYLIIRYNKKLENKKFVSGRYLENKDLKIDLSNGEVIITEDIINNDSSKNATNPLTVDAIALLAITLIVSSIIFILKKPRKYNYISLIAFILLIPLLVKAIEEYQVNVNSSIEIGAVKPNPCTYDGDLIDGVEYEKEQYKYIYDEELEGWLLSLIDKDSTEPVTSKICTRVNDKPIVSLSGTFYNSKTTSIDLSSFDTSYVVNMSAAFYNLPNITELDFHTFDTRKVTNMEAMFNSLPNIEEFDLSYFETPNLTSVSSMFNGDEKITKLDLSNFDTSKLNTFNSMINSCANLKEINLSNWDFSSSNSDNLFHNLVGDNSNNSIEKINMSNAKFNVSMQYAFSNLTKLKEIDLTNVDTSNVVTIAALFQNDKLLTSLNLSSFDTGNIVNMDSAFSGTGSLEELILDNWDFSNYDGGELLKKLLNSSYTNIKKISLQNTKFGKIMNKNFYGFPSIEEINMKNADTSNVLDMSSLFYGLTNLKKIDLTNIDTSNVTNMYNIFASDKALTELDLSHFNTSNVTNMNGAFAAMDNLEKLTLNNWDFSKYNTIALFSSIMGGNSPKLKILNLKNTKFGETLEKAFYKQEIIEELNLTNANTSNVTNMANMFYKMSSLTKLDIEGIDTSNVTTMESMFQDVSKLKHIDVKNFDTRKVTTMYMMFNGMSELEELDVTNFETPNLTEMYMFAAFIPKLSKLDLSSFDVSKFSSISWGIMYGDYNITEVDLSNWDMTNIGQTNTLGRMLGGSSYSLAGGDYNIHYQVKKIIMKNTKLPIQSEGLFEYIPTLEELDLTNADSSKVTTMRYMFRGLTNLKKLDLSSFDTSNVTNMDGVFTNTGYNVENFSLKFGNNFVTNNVTNMENMFSSIAHSNPNFILDLSTFNFDKVTNYSLFSNSSDNFLASQKIYVKDNNVKEWLVTNVGAEAPKYPITTITRNNVLIK